MKRLMPSTLITFLQQNPNCIKADCFAVKLPTGTMMYVTEGQFDIPVPGGTPGWTGSTTTFLATTYGRWSRGAITSEASFNLNSNSMALTCVAQQGTAYPGLTTGILAAARTGLFDDAAVTVYTVYMPSNGYGNVSAGIETKFFGNRMKITDINRTHVEFEVQDPLILLNEQVPKRLIQSGCSWTFGDSNCAPPGGVGAWTQTFTAAIGSTSLSLIPQTAFSQAAGFFSQGVVTCTAGGNAGLSQTVKLHASGTLTLTVPWLLPVTIGDSFSVIAGCDLTAPTCISKFNNKIHYGGMISIPPPITAL